MAKFEVLPHPGGNPGANLKSISHRCHPFLVAFVWKLTKKTSICPWVVSRVDQQSDVNFIEVLEKVESRWTVALQGGALQVSESHKQVSRFRFQGRTRIFVATGLLADPTPNMTLPSC